MSHYHNYYQIQSYPTEYGLNTDEIGGYKYDYNHKNKLHTKYTNKTLAKRKKEVNVITDKNDEISRDKYIKKISMIEKEIELNKSRDKIFKKTASMFDKKLRNLDELSAIADSKLFIVTERLSRS